MKRIWELDALRGVGIWLVMALHLLYDLNAPILLHPVVDAIRRGVGIFFVVLSGLCATLSRGSLRRGAVVFGCAMGITLVTALLASAGIPVIRFGVLHLLGISMLVFPLLKKLPIWVLASAGILMIFAGCAIRNVYVDIPWLFPLGLKTRTFTSGDYFPLLPFFGWFLAGSTLGKTLYREKQSRFPRFNAHWAPVRFFRWCGRNCLLLYLIHQPLLVAVLWLTA